MKSILKTIAAIFIVASSYNIAVAEDKGHDHDHDHEKAIAGPNGGRVLTSVEPHLEFFVTEDRKVKVTAVDDEIKPIAMGDQSIRVTGGDRKNPTRLSFAKEGTVLVSDGAFPAGNDFPVVVQIKTGNGKPVMEKFNLNLVDCPTCDYKEYACTCDHHHEGDGHDHDEPKKKD